MSCDSGSNQILSLNIPGIDNTFGTALDVSSLVGEKSIIMSGTYSGRFTVFGSHDGTSYVPVLTFNDGIGTQQVKQTFNLILKYLKVKREAKLSTTVSLNISSQTTCSTNNFVSLPVIPVGAEGSQASVDLYSLIPPTGANPGSTFIISGNFSGNVILEGSLDNLNFSPLGNLEDGTFAGGFRSDTTSASIDTPLQSPLTTQDVVRYLRLRVGLNTFIRSAVTVTLGAAENESCSSGGSGLAVFENVAAMTAAGSAGSFDGEQGFLQGYFSRNDGGEGPVYWSSSATATVNGGTIFAVTGTPVGRWIRQCVNNVYDPSQFGAVHNGLSDDTSYYQSCVDYARSSSGTNSNKCIKMQARKFKLDNISCLDGCWNISGAGGCAVGWSGTTSLFMGTQIIPVNPLTSNVFNFTGDLGNINLNSFCIYNKDIDLTSVGSGINININENGFVAFINLFDVRVNGMGYGLNFTKLGAVGGAGNVSVEACDLSNNTSWGFHSEVDQINNVSIINTPMRQCGPRLAAASYKSLTQGGGILCLNISALLLTGCDLEGQSTGFYLSGNNITVTANYLEAMNTSFGVLVNGINCTIENNYAADDSVYFIDSCISAYVNVSNRTTSPNIIVAYRCTDLTVYPVENLRVQSTDLVVAEPAGWFVSRSSLVTGRQDLVSVPVSPLLVTVTAATFLDSSAITGPNNETSLISKITRTGGSSKEILITSPTINVTPNSWFGSCFWAYIPSTNTDQQVYVEFNLSKNGGGFTRVVEESIGLFPNQWYLIRVLEKANFTGTVDFNIGFGVNVLNEFMYAYGQSAGLYNHFPANPEQWVVGETNSWKISNASPKEFTGLAVPTERTWTLGSRIKNMNPVVGQPKSWINTVPGTAGTWVSEGNL